MKSWNEMSKREQDEACLWDAYKDAYGTRPRHIDFSTLSDKDLCEMIEACVVDIQRNEEARQVDEKRAIEVFEKRIDALLEAGAKSREQALRWVHEAEETDGDDDYLCYTLGLPYGYFNKVEV